MEGRTLATCFCVTGQENELQTSKMEALARFFMIFHPVTLGSLGTCRGAEAGGRTSRSTGRCPTTAGSSDRARAKPSGEICPKTQKIPITYIVWCFTEWILAFPLFQCEFSVMRDVRTKDQLLFSVESQKGNSISKNSTLSFHCFLCLTWKWMLLFCQPWGQGDFVDSTAWPRRRFCHFK